MSQPSDKTSLMQKLLNFFTPTQSPITIPVTNKNMVIITLFVKQGIITTSYKGEHRRALLDDNVLRTMMHGKRFDENSFRVLKVVATLLKQLIIK